MGSIDDAFGAALLDFDRGGSPSEELLLEVDDSQVVPAMPAAWFFLEPKDWAEPERELLTEAVKGPVLDLGAGAGRLSLYFQSLGWPVVAVDLSPGAVQVCKQRGVHDARVGDLTDPPDDMAWSTILLMCGNLGLAGGWNETRALLTRLHAIAAPGAVILADTVDPTLLTDDGSRAHVQRNLDAGRPPGETKLRLTYGPVTSPWFRLLNVPIVDVEALVSGTGWAVAKHIIAGVEHYLCLHRT